MAEEADSCRRQLIFQDSDPADPQGADGDKDVKDDNDDTKSNASTAASSGQALSVFSGSSCPMADLSRGCAAKCPWRAACTLFLFYGSGQGGSNEM